jgi:TPR repeat protein
MRQRFKVGFLALAVGLLAAVTVITASADQIEDANTAYQRGDYATAFRLFRTLADTGDPSVQVIVGMMYAGGQGVSQDYKEALRWFRRAADQGNADAEYYLATLYEEWPRRAAKLRRSNEVVSPRR